MQLIIGSLMLWIAQNAEELMNSVSVGRIWNDDDLTQQLAAAYQPESHLSRLTAVFTMLVFFAATQGAPRLLWHRMILNSVTDIAVDGESTVGASAASI